MQTLRQRRVLNQFGVRLTSLNLRLAFPAGGTAEPQHEQIVHAKHVRQTGQIIIGNIHGRLESANGLTMNHSFPNVMGAGKAKPLNWLTHTPSTQVVGGVHVPPARGDHALADILEIQPLRQAVIPLQTLEAHQEVMN